MGRLSSDFWASENLTQWRFNGPSASCHEGTVNDVARGWDLMGLLRSAQLPTFGLADACGSNWNLRAPGGLKRFGTVWHVRCPAERSAPAQSDPTKWTALSGILHGLGEAAAAVLSPPGEAASVAVVAGGWAAPARAKAREPADASHRHAQVDGQTVVDSTATTRCQGLARRAFRLPLSEHAVNPEP